jgi:alpha-1,2-mannosyltransferase
LESYLREASVGIHTMWNEHFGISVVEMMAAGLVVVAHDSGGPSMDIVTSFEDQQTGYLASTPSEYANALAEALDTMSDPDSSTSSLAMRLAARASADRFSDEKFSASIVSHFQLFLKLQAQ